MAPPLNEDEVQQEMKKMIAFIRQEAMEKAREIRVKADEEFNIEKAKLVRQEALAIEANFAKKMKQASVQRKIAQSSQTNKSRIRVLQAREELLNQLYDDVKFKLSTLSQNQTEYQSLLEKLVLECLYILMENRVTIQCRRKDLALLRQVMQISADKFHQTTSNTVEWKFVPESELLDDNTSGGLIMYGKNGKIQCNNTLEKRLELLFESMLPSIRISILGASPNRKFFD